MNWLRLIPAGAYVYLCIGAMSAACWGGWHLRGVAADRDLLEVKASHAEAARLADRARDLRNAARQTAINMEAQDGHERIAQLERERDAARADGERLRDDLARTAARARALASAPAAGPGEPGPDPIGVFADLLARADRRAEAVEGYADRLRAAGLVCERGWDAVIQ